jgi:lipopolysaccharide export LptBFGC system permease protein LptF
MHAAVGSLVRRGFEMGHAQLQKNPQQTYKLPTWAAVVLGVTVLFFVFASVMVSSPNRRQLRSVTFADWMNNRLSTPSVA